MTPTEKAEQIIAFLMEYELNHEEMLETLSLARKKIEQLREVEQLNKPNKQFAINFEG